MSQSFTIPSSRCSLLSDPGLLAEIRAHTETDAEVESILRSIERFGGDGSIRSFEMTPKTRRGASRLAKAVSWNVRAVRT